MEEEDTWCEDKEGAKVRGAVVLRDPGFPTPQDVEPRTVTRVPFHSRCPLCDNGKAVRKDLS